MEGMHHARYIAQQSEHEIEPELAAQTDGAKHTKRWQDSSKDYVHGTQNHGSHGALLSECRRLTRGLVPGPSTDFLLAWSANSMPQRPAAPGTAPIASV